MEMRSCGTEDDRWELLLSREEQKSGGPGFGCCSRELAERERRHHHRSPRLFSGWA
jgi:hypothetical protein